jgi:hypothetical protein
VFSLLVGYGLLENLAQNRRDVTAKLRADIRSRGAAAQGQCRSSSAGIPANALIEASVTFGDGVMRFKQAFSCDADIGD